MKRDELIWLLIRVIGVEFAASSLVMLVYVAEYSVRAMLAFRADNPSHYLWLLGWSIVRTATYASISVYFLFWGCGLHRFVAKLLPSHSDSSSEPEV